MGTYLTEGQPDQQVSLLLQAVVEDDLGVEGAKGALSVRLQQGPAHFVWMFTWRFRCLTSPLLPPHHGEFLRVPEGLLPLPGHMLGEEDSSSTVPA